jgi:hypothetical protein
MRTTDPPLYIAALRMKAGELGGVSRLANDVKRKFWPHFIVPPPAERDDETQGTLMSAEGIPDVGRLLAHTWNPADYRIPAP